jgi:hypothetical protein
VSIHTEDVEYFYPVPTLTRDGALGEIQPYLMERDIYSRGRFGAWRYETSNMDHSVMQGVEVVDRLLLGEHETTWQAAPAHNRQVRLTSAASSDDTVDVEGLSEAAEA